MPSEIYRSYEVLVEETASNHHARKSGKTVKQLLPNALHTAQALKTTHEVFQDAVCYYILCLIGLIRNGQDASGKVVSPLWESVANSTRIAETHAVIARLVESYPKAPFAGSTTVAEFLDAVYGTRSSPAERAAVMEILVAQIRKRDGTLDCGDFAEFARDNGLRFCSTSSGRALPGCAPIDRLFWRLADAGASHTYLDIVRGYWKEIERTPTENERAHYVKAFSPSTNKAPLGISDEGLAEYQRQISESEDFSDFIWFHKSGPIGALHYAIARLCWLGVHQPTGAAYAEAEEKLKEYVAKVLAKEQPETEHGKPIVCEGQEIVGVPGLRPTFPYFTTLLGCDFESQGFRQKFDESALKRAFDEVFKYRNRTEERERLFQQRLAMVRAMETDGNPPPKPQVSRAKGKKAGKEVMPRNIGGLRGDEKRAKAMADLLDNIGGQIGYGLRRATIGGWSDLRQEFLKLYRLAAKDGEQPDEDELIEKVNEAQADNAGGFGSASLFRELCKPQFHILWGPKAADLPEHCPQNFVRWSVLYAEAKGELEKIAESPKDEKDWRTAERKPISFTWPWTQNRHKELSFRPLDFDCELTARPVTQLFHRERNGTPIKLVQTNSQWVTGKDEKKPWKPDHVGEVPYPMTLSFRRLKRDRLVTPDGNSMQSFYGIPLAAIEEATLPNLQAGATGKKPKNLAPSVSLLPPETDDGAFHLMFAFGVTVDELANGTKHLPRKSARTTLKNGRWVGLNLRWKIDATTEGREKRRRRSSVTKANRQHPTVASR